MKKEFEKGEKYRPTVEILKVKKGWPTVIKMSGMQMRLQHPDQYTGHKKNNHKEERKKEVVYVVMVDGSPEKVFANKETAEKYRIFASNGERDLLKHIFVEERRVNRRKL